MSTDRIPPNLSYLTIYNPTLRPSISIPDDEDAEEQAQILFYTSKERAVSRDRMLRQVGLAKALVNFSEMFNSDEGCENIHSQTRRMVMVFPEPDFCIHAGVELAKTSRATSSSKSKGKEKGEKGVKGILKGKDKEVSHPSYDYSDASVIDQALRADILRGYEQFKLAHGSFTSILSTIGQQALELQLERFFTVWAWSWNLEDSLDFARHLGIPLHPMHRNILPLLDTLSTDIPDAIPIAVISSHVIPSSRFSENGLPVSLTRYLLKLIPPSPASLPSSPPIPSTTLDGTLRPKRPPDPASNQAEKKIPADDPSRSNFMGMNMDVRRWSWLNFGKNGKPVDGTKETEAKEPDETQTDTKTNAERSSVSDREAAHAQFKNPDADINQSALDDAMASEHVIPDESPSSEVRPEPEKGYFTTSELDNVSIVSGVDIDLDIPSSSPEMRSRSSSPAPLRDFMTSTVYLAEETSPLDTRKRKIHYLTKRSFLIALIGLNENDEKFNSDVLRQFSRKRLVLFHGETLIDVYTFLSSTETIPSLTKILQPKDRHIFARDQAPFSVHSDSEHFASTSIHLFNAQALLQSDRGIQEVFSRGQSPQHWHIGRNVGQGTFNSGEMYMEVFRKETSLSDVDNVLTGAIRRMEEDVMP
ncbi:hypothetical protein BDP27DRAFT_1218983 [Rhodocollybia butyracea]|uniref:CCZ1/INTU/HSP4 first Longin domain-containing protein n=1 Tax=Rhodocollybia butyracea TaxID=206335 RepID=A0A9P5PYF5_9AGAR|nr:hypothetical protein BDP27DRAFT_1218983 [Rhodocollybia butyracea]